MTISGAWKCPHFKTFLGLCAWTSSADLQRSYCARSRLNFTSGVIEKTVHFCSPKGKTLIIAQHRSHGRQPAIKKSNRGCTRVKLLQDLQK